MRPRRPKQYCLQLDIALWCKNQIEHSIWDESLLFSNCARSLEYSSSSTLAGLSYHICGKLEVAFKGSPSSQHQHCTAEAQKAQKAETVLSAVSYTYIYIYIYNCRQYCFGLLSLISFLFLRPMAGHPVGKVQCPPDMTTKRLKRGSTSKPNSPGNRTPLLQA